MFDLSLVFIAQFATKVIMSKEVMAYPQEFMVVVLLKKGKIKEKMKMPKIFVEHDKMAHNP